MTLTAEAPQIFLGASAGFDNEERWRSRKPPAPPRGGPPADVLVSLEDCAASKSDCSVIATGIGAFDQADYGTGFGRLRIEMTELDYELGPARSVMLNLFVHDGSESHLWFAYGTTEYPASLTITQN